ncbi:class I adenylate-forming enzyme family protein [Luteolibacter sp. AS25]|uniref:class I adenylate-forming enzyme family protein n=1 Tax=Luteolibacter sp. AS25 TaxID=3135776 RepID=UPI00398B86CE
MNIVREIREQNHGELIAIREADLQISFSELFSAVDQIRQELERTIQDTTADLPRIGVIFPNGSAYIAVALAVLETGACFVPIPDELTHSEKQNLISDTALHFIIRNSDHGFQLPLGLGFAEINKLPESEPRFPEKDFNGLNPAFIRFSSGTTGTSKGVVISHESLFERILAANTGLNLSPGDRVLWTLPMAHHFAVTIILYLYHGVTTILETTHRPEELYRAARDSETNLLYGSPFHFAQLAQCTEAAPLPHLRMAISTAAALSQEVADAFKKRFQIPITQALGIIEIGLPILNTRNAITNPTALGQPLEPYKIAITSSGELTIKGPGMFDAYLLPWQPRKDGYFATGDLCEELTDGTLVLKGRSKSVINVGGMKVFPEEIEAILNSHPSIRLSRVFPQDHPTLGSFPCAEIILEDGKATPSPIELRTHCSKHLSSYKIPMKIQMINSIALTPSGKIKRT